MRRWNGWGDDSVFYPLTDTAIQFLAARLGIGNPTPDATLEDVLEKIPPSRLEADQLISTDPLERLRHARGQSLPDWIALRSGSIANFPDGIAYPSCSDEVCKLLEFARSSGTVLIPFGGGTSVVGHINPQPGEQPILTVDLSRLDKLLEIDENSRLATFEAGIRGPALEQLLRARGYTLGHFPQSFDYSSLGGWIATRSSGQQSMGYGRIEGLFAGGFLETPAGSVDLPPFPASAAGPDLRQIVLGSEGRLGVLTRAVVRIRSIPESDLFYGVFFKNWELGSQAVRTLSQANFKLSMLRLYDPVETETTLALSGKDRIAAWADRALRLAHFEQDRCLLIFAVTGSKREVKHNIKCAVDVLHSFGGFSTGTILGNSWRKSRFLTPYLRNTLWDLGYAVDTLETALPWNKVSSTSASIQKAIRDAVEIQGERVLILTHLSHIYPDGASLYITYIFRRRVDPDATLLIWKKAKTAASQAILANKGTISHQHGVGLDHKAFLESEKGVLGISAVQELCRFYDPTGIMNPGKLVP